MSLSQIAAKQKQQKEEEEKKRKEEEEKKRKEAEEKRQKDEEEKNRKAESSKATASHRGFPGSSPPGLSLNTNYKKKQTDFNYMDSIHEDPISADTIMNEFRSYIKDTNYTTSQEELNEIYNKYKEGNVLNLLTDIFSSRVLLAESIRNDNIREILKKPQQTAVTTHKTKFSDIAGLESVKNLIKESIYLPNSFGSLFKGTREPFRTILFYGPPGTGKTEFAKAISTEIKDSDFISISSSDIIGSTLGASANNVKNIFEDARSRNKMVVLFMDEIESFAKSRDTMGSDSASAENARVVTELLTQMEGSSSADNSKLVIIGATNEPQTIDAAIRRRFKKRIYIPLPDYAARYYFISKFFTSGEFANTLLEADLQYITLFTEGFSGSDINVLLNDVRNIAIKKLLHNKEGFKYTDFLETKLVRNGKRYERQLTFNNDGKPIKKKGIRISSTTHDSPSADCAIVDPNDPNNKDTPLWLVLAKKISELNKKDPSSLNEEEKAVLNFVEPVITFEDVCTYVLSKAKPSTNFDDLQKYITFTANYGEKGLS